MSGEQNDRVPPSRQVSPFDLLLTACALEGYQDGRTQPPERRRGERRRTQACVSSDSVRLALGQLIGGRYRIERELGEGRMGVVYLVADEQLRGERFAIKVLKEELQPANLTLLREEVRKTRCVSQRARAGSPVAAASRRAAPARVCGEPRLHTGASLQPLAR